MKKLIFTISAIIIIAIGASAQNAQWGVKGGLNLASEANGNGETGTRIGVHIGFFREFRLSNRVDIQPELLYSMQGGTYTISSINVTEKLDYINLPVMFKFYVSKNRKWSVDAGPQIGYIINAKATGGGRTVNVYDSDHLNKIEAAIALGTSYKLNDKFDLGIKFVGGITKIMDNQELTNMVVQLGAAYRF